MKNSISEGWILPTRETSTFEQKTRKTKEEQKFAVSTWHLPNVPTILFVALVYSSVEFCQLVIAEVNKEAIDDGMELFRVK